MREGLEELMKLGGICLIVGLLWVALAEFAGGQTCRIGSHGYVQSFQHHQDFFQPQHYLPYYQVGQRLRDEAHDTYAFRQSDEYVEYLFLKGYREGVLDGRGAAPAEEVSGRPENDFAANYPTLAAHCTKCHTGDSPEGGVFLDGTDPLEGDDKAAVAAAIVNGRMPKGNPLSPQDRLNALDELFAEGED